MQQTSLFAYQEIKHSLGDRQKAVYEALKMKDMTDQELATWLSWPINTVTPRRGELVKMGLIRKAGIKQQNGRPATIWEIGKLLNE